MLGGRSSLRLSVSQAEAHEHWGGARDEAARPLLGRTHLGAPIVRIARGLAREAMAAGTLAPALLGGLRMAVCIAPAHPAHSLARADCCLFAGNGAASPKVQSRDRHFAGVFTFPVVNARELGCVSGRGSSAQSDSSIF